MTFIVIMRVDNSMRVCVHMCGYPCICECVYVCVHMHMCVRVCMHTCTRACMYTCMRVTGMWCDWQLISVLTWGLLIFSIH